MKKKFTGLRYVMGIFLLVVFFLLFLSLCPTKEETLPVTRWLPVQEQKDGVDTHTFQFSVLADVQNGWGVFKPIMKEIARSEDSFAIIVGDMVEEGTEDNYRFFSRELEEVRDNIPVYFVPGNKDVSDEHNKYSLKNFQTYCGPDHYWFSWGNAAFVVVNDSQSWLTKEEFHWLRDTLRMVKSNFTHIFVFLHVPPFDPRDPWEGKHLCLHKIHRKRFMRMMEKFEVDYVFSGHIHCYFRQVINGVTYITSGGAGAPLKCPDGFYHYVRVSVRNEEIVDSVIKVKKDWWLELTGDIKYHVHIMRSFLRPFHTVGRSNPSSSFSPTD
jgi:3',5'-cyclic AMP phosphodiesterase CpdA